MFGRKSPLNTPNSKGRVGSLSSNFISEYMSEEINLHLSNEFVN